MSIFWKMLFKRHTHSSGLPNHIKMIFILMNMPFISRTLHWYILLVFIHIPYWLFPIGYWLLAIPYWLFPMRPPQKPCRQTRGRSRWRRRMRHARHPSRRHRRKWLWSCAELGHQRQNSLAKIKQLYSKCLVTKNTTNVCIHINIYIYTYAYTYIYIYTYI